MDYASSHLKALALNGVVAIAMTLCTGGAAFAGSFDGSWSVAISCAATSDGAKLPDIMKSWMESKAHREHILEPAFTEIGIGTARNEKGDIYYTQVFGVPFEK